MLSLGSVFAGSPSGLPLIPSTDLIVAASGMKGARNLRAQPDGTLVADADDRSLEYRISPRPDGGVDVLLTVPELYERITPAARRVSVQRAHLDGLAVGEDLAGSVSRPDELSRVALVAREAGHDTAQMRDGTLFVLARETGVLYRTKATAKK